MKEKVSDHVWRYSGIYAFAHVSVKWSSTGVRNGGRWNRQELRLPKTLHFPQASHIKEAGSWQITDFDNEQEGSEDSDEVTLARVNSLQ